MVKKYNFYGKQKVSSKNIGRVLFSDFYGNKIIYYPSKNYRKKYSLYKKPKKFLPNKFLFY